MILRELCGSAVFLHDRAGAVFAVGISVPVLQYATRRFLLRQSNFQPLD